MKQYCRYCAFCIPHRDYDRYYYCTDGEREITYAQSRKANKCENFALSDLGDVDTGKEYKPRGKRHMKRDDGAKPISIWDVFERINIGEEIQ